MITVIGTIFMDIKGYSAENYNPVGRNLGTIEFVHGGVGRNIAENIARMGGEVALLSSVDENGAGQEIIERLKRERVDTQYIQQTPQQGMGMWLAILDEHGNLAGSISRMPDLTALQQFLDTAGERLVRESTCIALEIDLNERISRQVVDWARLHRVPLYGIPGNMDVIAKHPDLLQGMDCFICNDIEASRLLEVPFADLGQEDQLAKLSAFVDAAGIQSMVVTLGERGSLYYDARSGERGYQDVFPVQMVDSTGAGDAFFSGTITARVRGLSLADAVICGTRVAGWTIESTESNCSDLKERILRDEHMRRLLSS